MTREEILWVYRVLLLREPDDEAKIDTWLSYDIDLRDMRSDIMSCLEYRIVQDREYKPIRAKNNRGVENRLAHLAKVFQLPPADLPDISVSVSPKLNTLLKAISAKEHPGTILVMGDSGHEALASVLSVQDGKPRAPIISNAFPPTSPSPHVIRLPLLGEAYLRLLSELDIAYDVLITDVGQEFRSIQNAYNYLPESGCLLCQLRGPDDPILPQLRTMAESVWGGVTIFDSYALVMRTVWPIPVEYHRRPASSAMHRKSKIAIATIVKNEDDILPQMLKSCLGLADHYVVMDTGSTDRTVDVARAFLSKEGASYDIHRIEFVDFSQARNAAIAAVPAWINWVLMLDADEYIEAEDLAAFVELIDTDTADVFLLPRYNHKGLTPGAGLGRYPDRQARLFRVTPDHRPHYINAIHEALVDVGAPGFPPLNMVAAGGPEGGPHIHHVGEARGEARIGEKFSLYKSLTSLYKLIRQ